MNSTYSIKFTNEVTVNQQIPFLDTNIIKRTEGTINAADKVHTNQYLQFGSMHPLKHKLSVVHTLLDHCQNSITDTEDQTQEEDIYQWSVRRNQ